jgi:penicillin-binding protein 2
MAILGGGGTKLAIPKLEPRLVVLAVFMVLALSAVELRLYDLQVINTQQMAEMANRNRIRNRRVPASRGLVFDCRHRVLVDTRPSFDAVLVPEDADNLSTTIENLERFLNVTDVSDKLSAAQDDGRPDFEPVVVKERLSWDQVVNVESHELELPGVSIQVTPRRRYPYGPLAAHLLGYVGEVSERELRGLPGYHMGDEIGKFGLEQGLEGYLRGVAGDQEIEVDAVGRRLRVLNEVPEQPGASVILTIDLDLQQAAEEALGARAGAIVAINPNNGAILAMASHPTFDPNEFAAGLTPAQWRQITNDPLHPLENRAIQGVYPPGSTFKLVDTIAGLQDHMLTARTTFFCPGGIWFGNREYRCWRKQGHGDISLVRAIVESCDVFFYNVGERLGVDRIANWAHQLGFGEDTGIGLAHERPGIIPSSAWKYRRFHERWYPAETLSVAIGQGYVGVTPLQLAQLAAEVADNGIRYQPHFVQAIEGLDGRTIKAYQPQVVGRIPLDPDEIAILRDATCGVVNNPDGTGHAARLPGIIVCGKTGSAQVVKEAAGARTDAKHQLEKYRDHAWFIAFAPRDNPQIAVACIIEHGGHGGSAAGPVVQAVMKKYFELYPLNQPQPSGSLARAAASADGRVSPAEYAAAPE